MRFVATVLPPGHPEDAAQALADAAHLTLAEARMRLACEPPALLALLEAEAAAALAGRLRERGLAALDVDARVPTDADRTIARTLAFADGGVTFTPRSGSPAVFAWSEVTAILRGARDLREETTAVEKVSRPSLGAALATGGLVMTKTSKRTVRSSEATTHQVILVFARDGRAAMIADDELEFSCLGAAMQPSSTANVAAVARRLREGASGGFYDERLLRLGRRPLPFVVGNEFRSQTASSSVLRSDSRASLDVLAEIMRQALSRGLLP